MGERGRQSALRQLRLPSRAQADKAFVANADFFEKYGVLLEMDENEFAKIN